MAVSSLSFRAYVSQLKGRHLGAFKSAAAKLGITFDDYIGRVERGQKCCTDCRQWKDRAAFYPDATRWDGLSSKCQECQSIRGRREPLPIDDCKPMGPARAPLVGQDADRARQLINTDVQRLRRPNPNDLYCAKCGHKGSDRRHEYHHHMGYSPDHVFDVVALCTTCHHEEHD